MIKKSVIENMDKNNPPMIIHPLCMWDYNEDKVVETVIKVGWKPPKLNDSNSTNCRLNSFACHNHLEKYGIHPYAFDIAGIVRNGDMSREVGLEKLHQELSQPLIDEAARELKLKVNTLKKP
jgi:tRNA(Ile)-lysidine synthase TilS/MesJ